MHIKNGKICTSRRQHCKIKGERFKGAGIGTGVYGINNVALFLQLIPIAYSRAWGAPSHVSCHMPADDRVPSSSWSEAAGAPERA